MSIESDKICCTQCDYETLEVYRPIIVIYVLSDGTEVETGRAKGWCYDCDAYADIENVDLGQLQRELGALQQKMDKLGARLECLSRGLLGRLRNASARKRLRLEIEWLEQERHGLSSLLEVAGQCASRPRCLQCWSQRTAQVSPSISYTNVAVDYGLCRTAWLSGSILGSRNTCST